MPFSQKHVEVIFTTILGLVGAAIVILIAITEQSVEICHARIIGVRIENVEYVYQDYSMKQMAKVWHSVVCEKENLSASVLAIVPLHQALETIDMFNAYNFTRINHTITMYYDSSVPHEDAILFTQRSNCARSMELYTSAAILIFILVITFFAFLLVLSPCIRSKIQQKDIDNPCFM